MNHEILLCDLPLGQTACVTELSAEGAIRRRLRDLGLIEGTLIECVGSSPSGDPHAYLIRGAVIAIRQTDSRRISVLLSSPTKEGAESWD